MDIKEQSNNENTKDNDKDSIFNPDLLDESESPNMKSRKDNLKQNSKLRIKAKSKLDTDLFEREAEESTDNENNDENSNYTNSNNQKKKIKHKNNNKKIKSEVSSSEEENNSYIDSSEEDDEEENEYINDGFVVEDTYTDENDDEEAEISTDEENNKKRKRNKKRKKSKILRRLKQRKEDELDEDDIALVRENLGYEVHDNEYNDEYSSDEEEIKKNQKRELKNDEKNLDKEIFGESDDEKKDQAESDKKKKTLRNDLFDDADELDYESDDMGEFIVSDEEDDDGYNDNIGSKKSASVYSQRKKKKQHIHRQMINGPSVYQIDEAEELFGDVDGFLEATAGADFPKQKPSNQSEENSKQSSLLQIYEPSVLSEHLLTEEHDEIRERDEPERFSADFSYNRMIPEDIERQEEAEWICDQMFLDITQKFKYKLDQPRFRKLPSHVTYNVTRGEVFSAIDSILKFLQQDKCDIPYIKYYCKDYYKASGISSEHLYQIYEYDIKWFKLLKRKRLTEKYCEHLCNRTLHSLSSATNKEDFQSKESEAYRCYLRLLREGNKQMVINEDYLGDMIEFARIKMLENDILSVNKANSQRHHIKHPRKRDIRYRIALKCNLHQLLSHFTVPAAVVGLILLMSSRDNNIVNSTICDNIFMGLEFENMNIPTPSTITPMDLAKDYICPEFPSETDVRRGTRYIAAYELANEPHIRRIVRNTFIENSYVNTMTTPKGRDEIDEFHYCHGYQYLNGMPLLDIMGNDIAICLDRAEKEGLIHFDIIYNSDRFNALYRPFEKPYLPSYNNRSNQMSIIETDWENERKEIIKTAIEEILLPAITIEVKQSIVKKGKERLARQCADSMIKRLMTRPFDIVRDGNYGSNAVAAWINNERNWTLYIVSLDVFGNLTGKRIFTQKNMQSSITKIHEINDMSLNYGSYKKVLNKYEQRFMSIRDEVIEFLKEHEETDVIVLNTSSGKNSIELGIFFEKIRQDILTKDNKTENSKNVPVYQLKDDVSRLFGKSRRSTKEFPLESYEIRCAISLGRYIQNPLSELCGLWERISFKDILTGSSSKGNEILYLVVHDKQKFLSRNILLKEYLKVFIHATNHIGVDINLATNYEHHSYMLHFICGLGPIKASDIIDKLKKHHRLEKRQDLLVKNIVGKTVYRNMAGFIRVRDTEYYIRRNRSERKIKLGNTNADEINPLDDTRIHPETYYVAVKLCGDASEVTTAVDMYNPQQFAVAVEDVMVNTMLKVQEYHDREEKLYEHDIVRYNNRLKYRNRIAEDSELQDPLSDLDIVSYNTRLEQENIGSKVCMLELIKRELRYPFWDKRLPVIPPNDIELFYLSIGETHTTFSAGMIVPLELVSIRESSKLVRARLQTHPDVRVVLYREKLPDYMKDAYLHKHGIPKGSILNAKILQVFKDNICNQVSVEVGCDEASLKDVSMCFNRDRFPFYLVVQRVINDSIYHIDKLVNRNPYTILEKSRHLKANAEYINNAIMTRDKQQQRRRRQIVHPSFRNLNYTSTLDYLKDKHNGECVIRPSSLGDNHLTLTWKIYNDIYRHFDIEEKDRAPESKIGSKLICKGEEYSNIDELLALFINPMNELIDEVVTNKNFRMGDNHKIEEELRRAKRAQPNTIPYIIHMQSKYPGVFTISYLPNTTCRRTNFDVRPEGFRFFGRIESVVIPTFRECLFFFKKKALELPSSRQTPSIALTQAGLKQEPTIVGNGSNRSHMSSLMPRMNIPPATAAPRMATSNPAQHPRQPGQYIAPPFRGSGMPPRGLDPQQGMNFQRSTYPQHRSLNGPLPVQSNGNHSSSYRHYQNAPDAERHYPPYHHTYVNRR